MNPACGHADRLARAIILATQAHQGQMRRDGKTPYVVHVLRVMEYLRRIAGETDENVLIAAVLHDTIEDCGLSFEDVAKPFGEDVATLVAEVSNDQRLPKEQRRVAMLEHLPKASARARRVKLADRLDNLLDLNNSSGTQDIRERYGRETPRILAACAGVCPALEQAVAEALKGTYGV